METSERYLLSKSTRMYEIDDEEEKDLENITSKQYEALSILETIGKDNFREIYLNFINNIKEQSRMIQKTFCSDILDKIEEIYDWKFPFNISLESKFDFDRLYTFLEFIEYDNIYFLSRLWSYMNVDLRKINIKSYCKKNADKIINEVDEQSEISGLVELISIFLRTYDKRRLIEFISKNSEKNKQLIILQMLEGETNERRED